MQDICTQKLLFSVLFLTEELHICFVWKQRSNKIHTEIGNILNEKVFYSRKNEYFGQYTGLIMQNVFVIFSVLGWLFILQVRKLFPNIP